MSDDSETDTGSSESEEDRNQSKKIEVIDWLFQQHWPVGGDRPHGRMIVTSHEVLEGINWRNQKYPRSKPLSARNPANFLKDFIRKRTCNANWPRLLRERRITARQLYGGQQVMEFVDYQPEDLVPFPDRFDPVPGMQVLPFEALSVPVEARELGRPDEPWLIQVIVSQRLLHAHFAIVAQGPDHPRFQTLAHLQTSVKTQPEIDATFVASVLVRDAAGGDTRIRVYITCEAKQFNERILEHQIREQVGKAFEITEALEGENAIAAVIPTVFQVVDYSSDAVALPRRGIYLAQFKMLLRIDFEMQYRAKLHDMPLEIQSRAFYEPFPPIKGISKRSRTRRSRR